MIEHNLRLVVSIAKHYLESRPDACRPDRGRQSRPDPRAREVRSRARLPLHDLRDLVDPPVDRARDHEPVAHDPAAGARGQGAQHRAARAAPPRDARHARRGTRPDARRRRASARQAGRAGAQGARLQRAHHSRSTRRSTPMRGCRSATSSPTTTRRAPSCCCTTPRSRAGSSSGWTSSPTGSAQVIERRYGLNGCDVATLEQLARELERHARARAPDPGRGAREAARAAASARRACRATRCSCYARQSSASRQRAVDAASAT